MASKYNILDLWNERYYGKTEVYDYAGRSMKKSACSNPKDKFQPTLDHINPLSRTGKDTKGNIVICNRKTNEEKADTFSTWKTNGRTFQAIKVKGEPKGTAYEIKEIK